MNLKDKPSQNDKQPSHDSDDDNWFGTVDDSPVPPRKSKCLRHEMVIEPFYDNPDKQQHEKDHRYVGYAKAQAKLLNHMLSEQELAVEDDVSVEGSINVPDIFAESLDSDDVSDIEDDIFSESVPLDDVSELGHENPTEENGA